MAKKRKKTIRLSERKPNSAPQAPLTPTTRPDGNPSALRNMRKGDLKGAIFGCKKNTMDECLAKQLFGLPGFQFAWIQNVEPGLPLFLFNMSDRSLHGVYEATSSGQMNIDPNAWKEEGEERTKFPAQVRVRLKKRCKPLCEDEFYEVIKANYHSGKQYCQYFYFELDGAQTKGLQALFKPSPAPYRIPRFPAPSQKALPAMPSTKQKVTANSCSVAGGSKQKLKSKQTFHSGNANPFAALGSGDTDEEDNEEEEEFKDPVSNWKTDEAAQSSSTKGKAPENSKRKFASPDWDDGYEEHPEEGKFEWETNGGRQSKAPANSLTIAGGSDLRKPSNHSGNGASLSCDAGDEEHREEEEFKDPASNWDKDEAAKSSWSKISTGAPEDGDVMSDWEEDWVSDASGDHHQYGESQILHGSLNETSVTDPKKRELEEPVSFGEADLAEKNLQGHSGSGPHLSGDSQVEQQSSGEIFEEVLGKLQNPWNERDSSSSKVCINGNNMPREPQEESMSSKEMSVLVEEKVSTPDQSREVHDNTELPKESLTLAKNGGNTKESTLDIEIFKRLEGLEKKQYDSDLEIQQLRNEVKDSGKLVEELKGRIKELESNLSCVGALLCSHS